MEMEIVKPFGDDVTTEETEVICLSKQKVKLHFYRWAVEKECPRLQIKDFSIISQRIKKTKDHRSEDEISLSTQRKDNIPQQNPSALFTRVSLPKTSDIQLYAGNSDLAHRVAAQPKRILADHKQESTTQPNLFYKKAPDGLESWSIEKDNTDIAENTNYTKINIRSDAPSKPELADKKHKPAPPLVMVSEKVHSGYLYISHELSPGSIAYEEFYVNDRHELSPVVRANTPSGESDVRPISGIGTNTWYEYTPPQPSETKEIWIAFSPVQWTYAHLTDPNWWSDRTQRVVCKAWEKGDSFNPNFDNKHVFYLKATEEEICGNERFNSAFKSNYYPETSAEELLEPQKDLCSMKVFLDDPIYLADQVSQVVEDELNALVALIESIKTGTSPDGPDSDDEKDPPDEDQCKYLHLLALTTYQLIFSNEKNIENYTSDHDGVNKDLVFRLLAVKERAYLSAAISAYRFDLGILLTSDKYQNSLDVYLKNIETRIHDGRLATLKHLAALSKTAGSVDNGLRLQPDQEDIKSDVWINEMSNLQSEEGSQKLQKTMKLLDKPVNFEKFSDCTDKEYAHSCPILASHFDNCVFGNDIDRLAVSIATRVCGASAFLGEALPAWREVEYNPSKFKKTKEGNLRITFDIPKTESKPKKKRRAALAHNNKILKHLFESHKKEIDITKKIKRKTLDITIENTDAENIDLQGYKLVVADKTKDSKAVKVFSRVVNHPIFLVSASLLQIVNVSQEIKHSKEILSKEERLKLWTDVVGATISVTNTAVDLRYQLNKPYKSYSFLAARSMFAKVLSLAAKKIVPGLDAVGGLASATTSIKNKDHDAALATTAGVATNLLVIAIGGAATWPLLLLGIGFFILADFLKDDEIEHYFKFFALSSHREYLSLTLTCPVGLLQIPFFEFDRINLEKAPHEVARSMCEKMDYVCSYGDESVCLTPNKGDQTFEMHYIKLMNLLCPIEIELTTYTAKNEWLNETGRIQTLGGPVNSIRITLTGISELSKQDEPGRFFEVIIRVLNKNWKESILPNENYSVSTGSDLSYLDIWNLKNIDEYISGMIYFRFNTSIGSMPLSYRNSKRYFRSAFDTSQTAEKKSVQVNTREHYS